MDEDSFRDNDGRVLFYTGLTNWKILFVVFNFVQSHVAATGHTSLSPFQQLLLTLMRLRLSLSVQDLGYRIHKSTVCRIFSSILVRTFKVPNHLAITRCIEKDPSHGLPKALTKIQWRSQSYGTGGYH